MNDTDTAGGPEFQRLVSELRATTQRQDGVAKARHVAAARQNANAVMSRAMKAFAKGEISGADLARLNAVKIRLDDAAGGG